jgi:hypothetical protein
MAATVIEKTPTAVPKVPRRTVMAPARTSDGLRHAQSAPTPPSVLGEISMAD